MSDVVVCVPKVRWVSWLAEGDVPGTLDPRGCEYHWFGGGRLPAVVPGDRIYIAAWGRLRGYAPLIRLETRVSAMQRWVEEQHPALVCPPPWWWPGAQWALVRQGGAVACTISQPVRGFRSFRYRWWAYEEEQPFAEWRTAEVCTA